jgi:hypothetical protein
MCVTAIPSWKAGDTFLAGTELVKFRILDVDTEQTPGDAHGVLPSRSSASSGGSACRPLANGHPWGSLLPIALLHR